MSEPEKTKSPDEADATRRRWWRNVAWVALAPRLALAIAGFLALAVGLKAAWDSDAATPALVVAAVLLTLAVIFASDLEELILRYKEGEVTYRRRQAVAYAELSEVLQVALKEEGDEGLRATIAQIASESSEAAVREAMAAERSSLVLARELLAAARPQRQRWRGLSPLAEALLAPAATHAIEEGAVTLTLMNPPTRSAVSTVATPSGTRHTKVAFRLGDARSVSVRFPQDFEPNLRLAPGTYSVEWRSMTVEKAEGGGIEPKLGPVVASDSFEVHELLTGDADEGGDEHAEA